MMLKKQLIGLKSEFNSLINFADETEFNEYEKAMNSHDTAFVVGTPLQFSDPF